MSQLDQCRSSITPLLREIDAVTAQYNTAKEFLHIVEDNTDEQTMQAALDKAGFTLTAGAGGVGFPVQLAPQSRASLLNMLESSLNLTGSTIIELWNNLHAVTTAAVEHCEQAKQQANLPGNVPPPQVQPTVEPGAGESIHQPPALLTPGPTKLEPQEGRAVGPVRTTPIGS